MTAHKQVLPKRSESLHQARSNNDGITDPDVITTADAQASSIYSDASKIAWDWIRWSGAKTFDGMDFAGEVLANFLGLTTSKFQWVLDAHEREEENRRLRKLEARQRRQLRLEQLLEEEQRKLQELEIGALEDNGSRERSS